ncbi:uncharacterized protein [Prorops nasuta]|uniref:uncharacterized protein isoform X2 n=1 Tax=Prorops nasuta TaxID=863751 RepID=UPI0034CD0EE6
MSEIRLYDSTICRLCAEDNGNGELLYSGESEDPDLGSMINRYLPLKVRDDGKLPRTICPGCNIQLEATVQFFELLVDGQKKIREMWKQQMEQQRKSFKEQMRAEKGSSEFMTETRELDNLVHNSEDDQIEQQIIIRIMPDGSMYAAEHEMSLQMEGLEKPRRKRGRPPKVHSETDSKIIGKEDSNETVSQGEDDKQDDDEELDGDGRRRRKRKVPKRFMEAVQGKELERIFKEEGVIDEEDDELNNTEDTEEHINVSTPDGQEEVIGHLETEEGKDLGELVIVNKGRGRGRPKLRRRKTKFTCQLCGRGFLQRNRYIIHKSFHKGVKYECTECKKLFSNKENFALHQKTTQHTGTSIVEITEKLKENENIQETLNEINGTIPKIDENLEEILIVSSMSEEIQDNPQSNVINNENSDITTDVNKTFTCDLCAKQFPAKEILDLHIKNVHEAEKPFTCNICNRSFALETNLKGHLLKHEGIKSEKGFPCDICGKVLNHPSSVVYHKEADHNNGRRPYVCKSCNASFKTKANLINHQSTHTGEKKYFCEICGQQFAHKTSLTLHYRWHTGHKPYTCDVCHKSFSQNGNLQEHMRIHTGEKPYSCDYCGRKFTTSSQFKLHVKRHTGERPWKCEFCAKCFLHKDTWKCHVRRHKGERPFQCAHCNRGFTEQWALKKHLRLHTGEKPYSCDVCGKAFADCSNLTKHKKVHRENKVLSVGDASDNSVIGEVWQILPGSQDADENSLGDQMTHMITTDETSGDGIQQIIYVSYQDPDDPNQSRTLHFVDASMMRQKADIPTTRSSLTELNVESGTIISDQVENETHENSEGRMNVELAESDLQLQITDEDGNPIPLSIQDARQLLSDGQFVSQLNEGQAIRVHSGVLSHQLAESLNVHVENVAKAESQEDGKDNGNISNVQTDAEAIVKALEDEETDATTVATINQIEGQPEMVDSEQTIEFTTQDGQKVRLVTSYHVDPLHLTSEYLTIV